MKSKLLILLFLINASIVYAQDNTGLIRGTVIDNATQVTLPGATILILDHDNKGVTTDIQNLTNRKNPVSVSYNPETGEEIFVYQLGIFPVFQYWIYF